MLTYDGAYGTATVHDISEGGMYWSYGGATMMSPLSEAMVVALGDETALAAATAEHVAALLAALDAEILAAEVGALEGQEV